jgi:hypothetical protein
MSKFAIGLLTLAMYAASLPVIAMITPAKAASSSSKHIMHKKHRGPGFSDPGFVGQARPVPRPSSEAVCPGNARGIDCRVWPPPIKDDPDRLISGSAGA